MIVPPPVDRPQPIRRFRSPRAIAALVLREMATSYGRNPGGYLWAILEPTAAILLLSFVFSLTFHAPALGTNFALFYATGYLPFMLFLDTCNKIGVSVRFSRPLLTYPGMSIFDAILARFLLNLLTHLMVFLIVVFGLTLFFQVRLILDPQAILISLTMASALALGMGTLNCYLMAAFPVWERVWQITTRPLFLVSGIIFLLEDVPAGPFRDALWLNPLFHVTGEMRRGFYTTYIGSYISPIYVLLLSLILLALGLMLLSRHHRALLND